MFSVIGLLFIVLSAVLTIAEVSVDDVSCGSLVKLRNQQYQVHLHSHDVQYGTGSGQQSVTAVPTSDDVNSYWALMAALGQQCSRGVAFECGSKLRLQHSTTKKFLHSHHFSSPLSHQQEISAFVKENEGDSGDNWVLVCSTDVWSRDDTIMLRHVDTEMYLCVSGKTFSRPISGQMEVVGSGSFDSSCRWLVQEGVYIKPTDGDSWTAPPAPVVSEKDEL